MTACKKKLGRFRISPEPDPLALPTVSGVPSAVLHCRGLPKGGAPTAQETLIAHFAAYGGVKESLFLREKGQALIELYSIDSAQSCINAMSADGPGYLNLGPGAEMVHIKYSHHTALTDPADQLRIAAPDQHDAILGTPSAVLHCRGLPGAVSEEDLLPHFAAYKIVSACV
eukprot:gene17972-biopygen2121